MSESSEHKPMVDKTEGKKMVEPCGCKEPWKNHPQGFQWDATDKAAVPRHFVAT